MQSPEGRTRNTAYRYRIRVANVCAVWCQIYSHMKSGPSYPCCSSTANGVWTAAYFLHICSVFSLYVGLRATQIAPISFERKRLKYGFTFSLDPNNFSNCYIIMLSCRSHSLGSHTSRNIGVAKSSKNKNVSYEKEISLP